MPRACKARTARSGRGSMRYMYTPEYGSGTKMEVLVPDSLVEQIVNGVLAKISTGSSSDGKTFGIASVYDIGTQESGNSALWETPQQSALNISQG